MPRTVQVPFDKLPPDLKLDALYELVAGLSDAFAQFVTSVDLRHGVIVRNQEAIMASNEEILSAAEAIQVSEEAEMAVIQQIIDKEQAQDQMLADLRAQIEQLNTDAMPAETRERILGLAQAAETQSKANTAALQALVATPPAPENPVPI